MFGMDGEPSALAKETIDIRRAHPDEVAFESAVRIDPCLDVGGIGIPERRRGLWQVGEMETETGLRGDANALARDMAEQHGAGRLARTDDPNAGALLTQRRPTRIVFDDTPAVSRFHIHIARMDVVPDADGALLEALQEGLSYPWLAPAELHARFAGHARSAPRLAFVEAFSRPAPGADA